MHTGGLIHLAIVAALAGAGTANARPGRPDVAADRLFVHFAEHAGSAVIELDEAAGQADAPDSPERARPMQLGAGLADVRRSRSARQALLVPVRPGADVVELCKRLAARADVAWAEPDYRCRTLLADPNDPKWPSQYGPQTIGAAEAWSIEPGREDVVVAIVDTGVRLDHEDLAAAIWQNPAEVLNGLDDDGNGYVDDVHGWNFVAGTKDPDDDHGHGTHCAGIVAAIRNNHTGIAGVASVTIMPVKVLDESGQGWSSHVAAGIRYAAENGADVISLSLGSEWPSRLIESACQDAVQAGAIVVAAAGNSGAEGPGLVYPGAYPGVIAVGATNAADRRAYFSSYGPELDVVAPGVSILSTYYDGDYAWRSGTSMATPHVAGAAALARSVDRDLSVASFRTLLYATARDGVGDGDEDTPGHDVYYGWGRIDAYGLIQQLAGGGPNGRLPLADPGPNREGIQNAAIDFDGSGSNDPDGSIEAYEWDFDHDGQTDAEGIRVRWAFEQVGRHFVTLKVTDNDANSTAAACLVTIDDRYEPNNAPDQATPVAAKTYTGLYTDDADFYKIALDAAARELRVTVKFSHGDGDIDLALYDEQVRLLATSTSTTDNERITVREPSAGVYYAKVYGYAGACNRYELNIQIEAAAMSPESPASETQALPDPDPQPAPDPDASSAPLPLIGCGGFGLGGVGLWPAGLMMTAWSIRSRRRHP